MDGLTKKAVLNSAATLNDLPRGQHEVCPKVGSFPEECPDTWHPIGEIFEPALGNTNAKTENVAVAFSTPLC